MILLRLLILWLACLTLPALAADPPPEKLRELMQVLADPQMQRWLAQQHAGLPAVPASAASAAGTAEAAMGQRIDDMREHIAAVATALPHVPAALAAAFGKLRAEMDALGGRSILVLLLAFALLGYGAERLFWLASGQVRRRIIALRLDTPGERLRAVLARFAFGTSWVGAFALGSLGAFLAFDWPPLMRELLLRLLMALVALRLAIVFGRFLFAPGAERFRLLPMGTSAAWYWHRRLVLLVGFYSLAVALIGWLIKQGVDYGVWRSVAYGVSLAVLALALEALWRRPGERNERTMTLNWLLSVGFVVLLLLRVVGAFGIFWIGALALLVYGLLRMNKAIETHMQRPPDSDPEAPVQTSVASAVVSRLIRLLMIVGAVAALVFALDIDPVLVLTGDALWLRMLRGAFQIAVVVLVTDIAWYGLKTAIERRLSQAQTVDAGDAQAARAMRMRTVLPIVRNMSMVVLVTVAVLMALSALGVDIAPLVAGAGVVGIAVGFGAQTLVKDVVSGVFYLLDDAFRVGEYIQSGSYKGTVEAFSLRSVKLRHHRGPVYTVPFGELGAVQNMSRDWVIDKLTVGITYDSNLETARKLIKNIGQQLAADPEMGPNIIEPLKMQGVEQFGDFAIQIRMKMTTRPGEQFVIRRKALAMIKTAFDANGIHFAFPTVQIAGGTDPAAAAAQQMLSAQKPTVAG